MSDEKPASVRLTVEVTCVSVPPSGPSLGPGALCGRTLRYEVTDTGVDGLARARGERWHFFRGAARCPACSRAGASFGKSWDLRSA